MRAKVTERGIMIPKEFLQGVNEVEIQKRNGMVVVVPVSKDDPIFDMGKDPISLDIDDASTKHDKYLY